MRRQVVLALLVCGCRQGRAADPTVTSGESSAQPTPVEEPAEDGQWRMVGKDYQNRRYSGLAELNPSNVGNLKVAWTFSTGIGKGHEGPPLVENDSMYVITPYPNEAYAFDLRKPGGPPKWSYKPRPPAAAQGVA